jgi:zinc transporter ZupT
VAAVFLISLSAIKVFHRSIDVRKLQVFVAISFGFLFANLFLEILPESLAHFNSDQHSSRLFFIWMVLGVVLAILFERFIEPRLAFVENLFGLNQKGAHAHHDHHVTLGDDESHHHHDTFAESASCDHSHEHSHLHQHTHQDWFGSQAVCSVIACFMTCAFFDGIAMGAFANLGSDLSMVFAIGVIIHSVPEAILSGLLVVAGGGKTKGSLTAVTLIGTSFVLGALIPTALPNQNLLMLGIAAGIMNFVLFVQLLPTALRVRFGLFWILAGFGLFAFFHQLLHLGQHQHF